MAGTPARRALFAVLLVVSSAGIVQKYGGSAGVVAFAGVVVLAVAAERVWLRAASGERLTDVAAGWLAASTIVILALLHLVLYPAADAGRLGGGTDTDDALNAAARDLLAGRYPYDQKTYAGNPITPLPGAIVLALPFVVAGNSSFQNVFWLAALFHVARGLLGGNAKALRWLWTIIALSPIVMIHVITGNDHLANGIYVLVCVAVIIGTERPALSRFRFTAMAAFFGVALSSRANFLLVMPLVWSALAQRHGWHDASRYAALGLGTFAAITIPFWLYDPGRFSPLYQHYKLSALNGVIPRADAVVVALNAALALMLSTPRWNGSRGALLRNCAIVLVFPVACVIVLTSAESSRVSFIPAHYAIFALFFGALAAAIPDRPFAAAGAGRNE